MIPRPHHALQLTRRGRLRLRLTAVRQGGCNRRLPCAGSPGGIGLDRLATRIMHYTIAIVLTFAIGSVHAADKVSAPDFSRYPQTGSFVACMREHTNAAWHLHQRTNLLAI